VGSAAVCAFRFRPPGTGSKRAGWRRSGAFFGAENLGGAAPSERELRANESSIDRWLPGALRYEVTEAPQLVYTCHCTECQRLTGSAFSHGISANTRFEVCIAKDYPETGFDLAAFFDCLFTTGATWATRPARRHM
jgi:hypothetical protein